eukprot:NODE_3093_length_818_cov_58.830949_g1571_i1.p1 GENE.NODE_3093_length_818_cov_58.830949_g1571_i1~~NODE_3093_length_818_cov_58.830949_g1571_i1.p1  ORF type:complete len:115 (-),score=20.21 NODE_3093_length_818_cov_58.830949_g1571_i1:99-443(-)
MHSLKQAATKSVWRVGRCPIELSWDGLQFVRYYRTHVLIQTKSFRIKLWHAMKATGNPRLSMRYHHFDLTVHCLTVAAEGVLGETTQESWGGSGAASEYEVDSLLSFGFHHQSQ